MRGWPLLLALALPSCADSPPGQAAGGSFGGGIAARIDGAPIPAELVARVAAEQRVTPREALGRLIGDAVAAGEAEVRGVSSRPGVSRSLRAVLARVTLSRIKEAGRAKGPPSDQEIAALTEELWLEVDRPAMVSTVHAVVLFPKSKDPELVARARELARTLRQAVGSASTPQEFEALARSVDAGKLELTVERLPDLAADGRSAAGGTFDHAFVRGAFALEKPGDTSPVVESSFGFHVIRLVARRPEHRLPLEERRTQFADEAHARRSRGELDALLAGRRADVSVAPAAEAILASLPGPR